MTPRYHTVHISVIVPISVIFEKYYFWGFKELLLSKLCLWFLLQLINIKNIITSISPQTNLANLIFYICLTLFQQKLHYLLKRLLVRFLAWRIFKKNMKIGCFSSFSPHIPNILPGFVCVSASLQLSIGFKRAFNRYKEGLNVWHR